MLAHSVVQAILEALNEPLMSVSLILKGHKFYHINDIISGKCCS
jgi:tRNA A37 threonylcarbamoyladenosine synthetase subunit TsaC/SUA5/YrdC